MTACDACTSCTPKDPVSYYLNWVDVPDPQIGYKETCVYDVTYVADYNENGYNYSSQSGIGIDISYQNSTYVVTTEILQTLPDGITADSSYSGKFYKITSTLNINVTYSGLGTFNDEVISTVYFCDHNTAFAPIYSAKSYDTTNIKLEDDGTGGSIIRYIYSTQTVYDKGTAYFTVSQPTLPENTATVSYPKVSSVNARKVNGTYKDFIDNETLLFASRNLPTDKTTDLKVASTSYLDIVDLQVYNLATGSVSLDLMVDGSTKTVQAPCATMALCKEDDTFTGSPIIIDITTGETKDGETTVLKNNAYICKMITKLPSYTGAVQYLLKSVTSGLN